MILKKQKLFSYGFSLKSFNIDSIYLSEQGSTVYDDRVKIAKRRDKVVISTAPHERQSISLTYAELYEIKVFRPDEAVITPDTSINAFIPWLGGLKSLVKTKLRIGGKIEFHYMKNGTKQEVVLYHSKQTVFDLFKYIVRKFKKYIN